MSQRYDPPLDDGIATIVEVLAEAGIDTFESCEGGDGHAFTEPTVRFHGDESEGFRAMSIAMSLKLPVDELRRAWRIEETGPVGPWWELTFRTMTPTGTLTTP